MVSQEGPTAAPASGASVDDVAIRRAMLSVYYHALGRQLRLSGAPAVGLPPEVRPMALSEALHALKDRPDHLRQAAWIMARGVPVSRFKAGSTPFTRRYPPELQTLLCDHERDLECFDGRRTTYRCGSHLFAGALISYAQQRFDESADLARLFRDKTRQGEAAAAFIAATEKEEAFGKFTPAQYLDDLARLAGDRDNERPKFAAAGSLAKMEYEVGLPIYDFTEQFADTLAFIEMWPDAAPDAIGVYPASSVTLQDTTTLAITVTVTAFVSSPNIAYLACGIDPRSWTTCSQVFRSADLVKDRFTLEPEPDDEAPALGTGWCDERLVNEEVEMRWGEEDAVGWFHNVLSVKPFSVGTSCWERADKNSIDLVYSLARSIESRVLWDERAGGLLMNQGYIKVRPVVEGLWRVTTRKVLQFSDRTPYSGGSGMYDFGQMLSFLAPAALNWWLETEMYSGACPDMVKRARSAAGGN